MGRPESKIDLAEVEIRPLKKSDISQVLAIESRSFPSPWSDRLFLNELGHDFSYFLVLLLTGKLVGYAGFWLIAKEAHITNLAVHQGFRRRGLGHLLVESMLDLAYSVGARSATLEVRPSNVAAIKLYTGLNFKEIAIRKNYYADSGENAIIMWLNPLNDTELNTT